MFISTWRRSATRRDLDKSIADNEKLSVYILMPMVLSMVMPIVKSMLFSMLSSIRLPIAIPMLGSIRLPIVMPMLIPMLMPLLGTMPKKLFGELAL